MLPVTAFFAGIMALWFVGLSAVVILRRQELRLPIGDGGDSLMARRIRVHGNFVEYVPMALVLMGANELNGGGSTFLGLCGAALVTGRLCHAYSLLVAEVRSPGDMLFRKTGMVMTLGAIFVLALAAVF